MVHHSYIFFDSHPSLHTLAADLKAEYMNEFLRLLTSDPLVIVESYSTLGLKADTRILLWFQSDKIDSIQKLLNTLMHSRLGAHLTITHTLFGMTRQTQYSPRSTGHVDTARKGMRYLIIYPFTKTKEWYLLDFEERKKLMSGHITIGKKHPSITQLLLYSFGVDDQEFIVSYETDDLSAFQTLVMELRSDQVRAYTLRDTPLFTCIYQPHDEVLSYL